MGTATDDSKPRDADEQALYHQYQVDLWKLRTQKAKGEFRKPTEIVVPTIKKEPDIPVTPMVCSSTPGTAAPIKNEPEIPVQAVAAETIVVPTITQEPCEFSELDLSLIHI